MLKRVSWTAGVLAPLGLALLDMVVLSVVLPLYALATGDPDAIDHWMHSHAFTLAFTTTAPALIWCVVADLIAFVLFWLMTAVGLDIVHALAQ